MPRKNTPKQPSLNPYEAQLAEMAELIKTRELHDVIEFIGWLPSENPDADSLLEMDLDGDMVWGARSNVITDGFPEVRVYVMPETRPGDVRRILRKIISAIEEYGMPDGSISYSEMQLPPHVRHRLKMGTL